MGAYAFGLLPDTLLNDYDRLFMRRSVAKSKRFYQGLEKGILAFADTQLLQGIAILIAGFTSVDELTVYHWQIVIYLAW